MEEMKDLLKKTIKLPTLPSVATRIVQIANKPEVNMAEVSKILSMDPALSSKVLRFANSAAYGMSSRIESLNRAVVVMGMDAVINISLSFTLVSSLRMQEGKGLNYALYWRRSLISAAAARVIGEVVKEKDVEELFLAGLLQDIGMLAIDRIEDEFYNGLGEAQKNHAEVQAYERALFGSDHTYIGKWLMGQWGLAPRMIKATELSHLDKSLGEKEKFASFVHCVMLSGRVADLFISEDSKKGYGELAKFAMRLLKVNEKQMISIIDRTGKLVKSIEKLFDMKFIEGESAIDILSSANEALMMRNVEVIQKLEDRPTTTRAEEEGNGAEEAAPSAAAAGDDGKAEDKWKDSLTGLPNRDFLQHYLKQTFARGDIADKKLHMAVVDLDAFQKVNAEHGRGIGDLILKAAVKMIKEEMSSGQVLARTGGSEFALLVPAIEPAAMEKLCDNIVQRFADKKFPLKGGERVTVTVSVGLASHGGRRRFELASDLQRAAQFALAAAKLQGRDRTFNFDKLGDVLK